ncbi:hypothetical protein IQ06DRAFT_348782 [Phaeosphaeriaceae sp. SRC1lsM3a]|nr:hypothetical protein IQ06DRAFT_348782 [Stagonospora sp. SRC1lsM3a]
MPRRTGLPPRREENVVSENSSWNGMQDQRRNQYHASAALQPGDPQPSQPGQGPMTSSSYPWISQPLFYGLPSTTAPAITPARQEIAGLVPPLAPPANTALSLAYTQSSQAYFQATPSQQMSAASSPVEIVAGSICYTYPNDGNARSFRCNVPRCNGISFARMVDFERHYNQLHALQPPQFWCPVPGCKRDTPFPRRDKMEAHAKTRHE